MRLILIGVAATLAAARVALACPSCEAGRAARAMVVSDAFWLHLWALALPFVVVWRVGRAVLRRVDATERGARRDG